MRSATRKKTGKDRDYLAFIASLACVACVSTGAAQVTRTEVAHIGLNPHGLSQRPPDAETIPLCRHHHREGPGAQHVLGKAFWRRHGLNKAKLIKMLQAKFRTWQEDGYAEAC